MSESLETIAVAFRALESLVDEILFGPEPWPPEPHHVQNLIASLRLEEVDSDNEKTVRTSTLGRLVHLDLYLAFLGICEPADIPLILLEYELCDREEAHWLWDQLEAKREVGKWLRKRLQFAYRDHYSQLRLN